MRIPQVTLVHPDGRRYTTHYDNLEITTFLSLGWVKEKKAESTPAPVEKKVALPEAKVDIHKVTVPPVAKKWK